MPTRAAARDERARPAAARRADRSSPSRTPSADDVGASSAAGGADRRRAERRDRAAGRCAGARRRRPGAAAARAQRRDRPAAQEPRGARRRARADPRRTRARCSRSRATAPTRGRCARGRAARRGRRRAAARRGRRRRSRSSTRPPALYVTATRYEGFGLPVLEAMARGVPVVCSDLPVLREVAGDAAVWVDPGDPAAIGRAISARSATPSACAAPAGRGRSASRGRRRHARPPGLRARRRSESIRIPWAASSCSSRSSPPGSRCSRPGCSRTCVDRTFDGWLVPVLGFFLLPWTTLAYIWRWDSHHAVAGLEWFLAASRSRRRRRLRARPQPRLEVVPDPAQQRGTLELGDDDPADRPQRVVAVELVGELERRHEAERPRCGNALRLQRPNG